MKKHSFGVVAKWLRQRIANPSRAGSTPARPFDKTLGLLKSSPVFFRWCHLSAFRTIEGTRIHQRVANARRRSCAGQTVCGAFRFQGLAMLRKAVGHLVVPPSEFASKHRVLERRKECIQ